MNKADAATTLISRARIRLMLDPMTTYWAAQSLYLQPTPITAEWWKARLGADTKPTMCTDGVKLYYHSPFVESLPSQQLDAVMVEETAHTALGHPFRCGARDPRKWNIAADGVLHDWLTPLGYKFPPGGVDMGGKAAGKSVETVYAEMPDPPPGGSGCQWGAPPLPGWVIAPEDGNGNPLGEAELSALKAKWDQRLAQGLQIAKAAGTVPGGADRLGNYIHQSKVPWQEHLQRFFSALVPFNYTWHPIDRRFAHLGLYLPGIERRGTGHIAFLVDVSGSIGQRWLDQCTAELVRILDEIRPETVHVIYFDSIVQTVEQYQGGDAFSLHTTGGGGTDFRPPFDHIDKLGTRPLGVVVFTDLECSSYPEKPPYPVIWVTDSPSASPQFGDVIRLEV